MPATPSFFRKPQAYRGSAILASCLDRMLRVLIPVVFLWGLTGWAMGW